MQSKVIKNVALNRLLKFSIQRKKNYIDSIKLIHVAETVEITNKFSNVQLKSSTSSAELPTSSEDNSINKPNNNVSSMDHQWNPFEDPTPFNQMTEDHIYEAEFDALRDRPSGMIQKFHLSIMCSSFYYCTTIMYLLTSIVSWREIILKPSVSKFF